VLRSAAVPRRVPNAVTLRKPPRDCGRRVGRTGHTGSLLRDSGCPKQSPRSMAFLPISIRHKLLYQGLMRF